MELKQLRCFVAVAEELNFTVAARKLYLTQQALSRIIRQLERDLDATLFERSTRSVRLTPAGTALLESSRRTLAEADEAVAAVRRAARAATAQPLRVDVSSSGLRTGAEILRRLRRDHPTLPVEQVEYGVPRGLDALVDGRLDALFGIADRRPPTVRAAFLRAEPVLVAMAAGHPLATLDAVPVARLSDVDLLLPSEDSAPEWVAFVDRFCRQAGFAPRRLPGATHGQAAHVEVLRESGAVTPTAAWSAPPAALAFRPLVDPTPVFPWSIMTLPPGARRPAVATLLEVAATVAAEQGWSTVDTTAS